MSACACSKREGGVQAGGSFSSVNQKRKALSGMAVSNGGGHGAGGARGAVTETKKTGAGRGRGEGADPTPTGAPRSLLSSLQKKSNQVGHVGRHLRDGRPVEGLNVAQGGHVLGPDQVDGDALREGEREREKEREKVRKKKVREERERERKKKNLPPFHSPPLLLLLLLTLRPNRPDRPMRCRYSSRRGGRS